jgi:hypothetical protein
LWFEAFPQRRYYARFTDAIDPATKRRWLAIVYRATRLGSKDGSFDRRGLWIPPVPPVILRCYTHVEDLPAFPETELACHKAWERTAYPVEAEAGIPMVKPPTSNRPKSTKSRRGNQ